MSPKIRFWSFLVLASSSACASREFAEVYEGTSSNEGVGGGCDTWFVKPVASELYFPGSYQNRNFLSPQNHLGEDILLPEGTPVVASGRGKLVVYRPAAGYGELAAVIEHDFETNMVFENGAGEAVVTDKILTISGHLRKSSIRGSTPLDWQEGDAVEVGDVIGFINDDAHNGEGSEHLHFGTRLMSAEKAKSLDPHAWFRGYDTVSRDFAADYGRPATVLDRLSRYFSACEESQENSVPNLLVSWAMSRDIYLPHITLSGMIIENNQITIPWHEIATASGNLISARFSLSEDQTFEFSVEFQYENNETGWSCVGIGQTIGYANAEWGTTRLEVYSVSNGMDGCNLRVTPKVQPQNTDKNPAPNNSDTENSENIPDAGTLENNPDLGTREPEESEFPEEIPPEETPPEETPPEEDPTPRQNNITCSVLGETLTISIIGDISETLVGGPLPFIGFISLGSNINGWQTQTNLPTYYTIYNGDAFLHELHVPNSINRFNLWVGNPDNTRWFNLASWQARGAGCQIVPDGLGGLVITR